MWRPIASLAPLVSVLAIPFLLRPKGELIDETSETVVIVTPHNEAIRYEFGRAFREHMRQLGRNVRVDWRNPGGGSEVARYLASEYAASFETYWTRHEGHPYTSYVAGAFANPSVKLNDSGPDPHLERLARATFLASNIGSGLDLLFGGGTVDFVVQATAGRVVDSGIVRNHPELFGDAIPEQLAGEPLWDREGRWFGACVSGFGICYNPEAIARRAHDSTALSFDELATPIFWADRACRSEQERVGGEIARDGVHIQQEMNRRSAELAQSGLPPSGVAERAPSEGWERALRLIRRLSANARYFTDAASKSLPMLQWGTPKRECASTLYGRIEGKDTGQEGSPRLRFVAPRGSTSVGADPIALLRGAPHRELALAFLEFAIRSKGRNSGISKWAPPGGRCEALFGASPSCQPSTSPSTRLFAPIPTKIPTETAANSPTTRPGPPPCSARSRSSFAPCASTPTTSCAKPTERSKNTDFPPSDRAVRRRLDGHLRRRQGDHPRDAGSVAPHRRSAPRESPGSYVPRTISRGNSPRA